MIKTNLIGENIELTKALKEYANKKALKIGRYFKEDEEVTLKINFKVYHAKKEQKCEINLNAPGFPNLSAETYSKDMYKSIDESVNKISRQIKKELTKVNRKQREI